MRKIIIAFILSLFCFTSTFAQWTQKTSNTSDRLWVADFASETNAVIGSSDNNGTFLISEDEGDSWTNFNTGEEYRFYDIDMVDANIGRACGYGVFMATENGGKNWTFTEVAGTTFIQSLDFIDEDTGWIVGFQGMIMKTTNAGEDWTTQTTGVPHDIWEVQAINKNLIFAAGRNTATEKGMFFITTNGGEDWQTEEILDQLTSVGCIDESKWFAGGENGKLFYTDDAGETWTNKVIKSGTDIMEIKFLDQNNGFLMCYDSDDPYSPNSYIYKTEDGGENWELSFQTNSKKLYSIAFSSLFHGIACGADGVIYMYDDEPAQISECQEFFKIYPNPTNGLINIEFADNEIQQIKISDLTGKTIIEKTNIQQNETIDLSSFASGIYIIKIRKNNEIFTTKIVKE